MCVSVSGEYASHRIVVSVWMRVTLCLLPATRNSQPATSLYKKVQGTAYGRGARVWVRDQMTAGCPCMRVFDDDAAHDFLRTTFYECPLKNKRRNAGTYCFIAHSSGMNTMTSSTTSTVDRFTTKTSRTISTLNVWARSISK